MIQMHYILFSSLKLPPVLFTAIQIYRIISNSFRKNVESRPF